MSVAVEAPLKSFVLLPLGNRRMAVPAQTVIELVAAQKLQTFPHSTPWVSGVLVRRNRVVPVCDLKVLFGEDLAYADRFYLIAEWQDHGARDWCAIPVAGDCELASAPSVLPSESERPAFVAGFIREGSDQIEVLDLSALIRARRLALSDAATEPAS